jgi:hypothetical protein
MFSIVRTTGSMLGIWTMGLLLAAWVALAAIMFGQYECGAFATAPVCELGAR